MQCAPPTPGVRDLRTRIEAALLERQALLAWPDADAPQVRDYIEALGLRITWMLEQVARLSPPLGALDDQAALPGKFDRFLNGRHAERRAG
jgi:hypothetical protein